MEKNLNKTIKDQVTVNYYDHELDSTEKMNHSYTDELDISRKNPEVNTIPNLKVIEYFIEKKHFFTDFAIHFYKIEKMWLGQEIET